MFVQPGSEQCTLLDERDGRIGALPILVLSVHSRCNCRCVMCDIWKRDQSKEITAADLQRHRESLRRLGVEWVVLTGGEPLMNCELSGLCVFFRELGIRLTLLTTGLLLERRANEVATAFDDIIVSLDGPKEIHDAIRRVPGCYNMIQSGIESVRRLRREMRITARTTVQKQNHTHLRSTASAATSLGFDGISFLAADLTSEAFNRPLQWPVVRQSEIGLSTKEVNALEHEVEDLIRWSKEESHQGFVAEGPAKLQRIVRHFRAHLGEATFESPKCNAPWVSAVVEVDGTVRPCFFHHAIGNIQRQTLEEVVNGEEAVAMRRSLDVASDPICQRCVCSLYRNQTNPS